MKMRADHSPFSLRKKAEVSWKRGAGFHSYVYSLLIGKKYFFVDLKFSVCEVE